MNKFDIRLNEYVSKFNAFVDLNTDISLYKDRDSVGFRLMLDAMNYSLKNGGKRIRPVLAMEFCRLISGNIDDVLFFALAIEMVHTYSLIHDDLPCMDDDNIRRGKPSNHIVYGFANALLAGDGLLTMAFEMISKSDLTSDKKIEAVSLLSKACGSSGMIAGQVMDLQNESQPVSIDKIIETDSLKTGEMIIASALMGCIAAGADDTEKSAAIEYCKNIGLAFQIVDDILDVTGDEAALGKPIGSDADNEKSTYVSLLGLEKAKSFAKELSDKAIKSLEIFGEEAWFLKELTYSLLNRNN